MNTLRFSARLMSSFVALWAFSAASPACWAAFVYFDGGAADGGLFLTAANWDPNGVPGANLVDIYGIDDGFSSTYSSGTTAVAGLRVGSPAKEHQFPTQQTRFGRLTMTGGTLEVIGVNTLAVGRERENGIFGGDYNKNSFVDAADYTVWRDTLGSMSDLRANGDNTGTSVGVIDEADFLFWRARFGNQIKGGEFIMTGDSILRANGALIGERTRGLLSIGPESIVDIRIWDTVVEPDQFGGTEDLRVGGYGPAFDDFGAEPGLDGIGLIDVQGMLTAKDAYVSEHGGKGEIRLAGGTVNLNGALIMDFCGGCVPNTTPANMAKLAQRSSKITIVGSSGTFNVGLDPDPMVVDPMPSSRDLLAASPTALFSFTADGEGVTPIVVVDNGAELSGTANIAGAKLELNLDDYGGAGPLILIDAIPGNVSGTFGMVTFLGTTTATVNYEEILTTGNVRLTNFQNGAGAGAGSLAAVAVPEPSGLAMMTLTMGFFVLSFAAAANRQSARFWGYQCLKIRA